MSKSWEQILGGYATNTLTEEEKRQLFEAALHDQALFDALADEEALKALLADPNARQRILTCLRASGNLQEGKKSSRRGLSWFRQPSSLVWAGSIAAAGLALIFGWQMGKDWGPMVQQEQETGHSGSEDKEGVAFRSQLPATAEMKEQDQDQQKQDQREPARVAALSVPVPTPQASTIAKASKDSERMREPSAQFSSKADSRLEVKNSPRLKAKESVPQTPESVNVQNIANEEKGVAPAVSSSEAFEQAPQQLARPPAFADKLEEGKALPSPSIRDLFYANKIGRVDVIGEEIAGVRAKQQLLEGLSSKTEKRLKGDVVESKKSPEVVQDFSQGQTTGIRYSFVRRVADGKDETIDIAKFSGKWSDLLLEIESNVSGYLYVLTNYGTGKWQWMRSEFSNVPRSSDGAIKMKGYQSVYFAVSQVTNTLGKPVVSSITVLLSSSPLTDLGKWLGKKGGMSGYQVESLDGTIFVIEITSESVEPLRADVPLGE